jgi:hypothetical protein
MSAFEHPPFGSEHLGAQPNGTTMSVKAPVTASATLKKADSILFMTDSLAGGGIAPAGHSARAVPDRAALAFHRYFPVQVQVGGGFSSASTLAQSRIVRYRTPRGGLA